MSVRKGFQSNRMSPLKGKIKAYEFVGFDVETVNDVFYCGCLYWIHKGKEMTFFTFDKTELAEKLLSREFNRKWIVATNLSYDFSSVFFDTPYWEKFSTILFRSSRLLYCDYRGETNKTRKNSKIKLAVNQRIQFIDTLNYAQFPLHKLGKIIDVPKYESPIQLFERKADWTPFCCTIHDRKEYREIEYLKMYNIRDAKISHDFMLFYQQGLNTLGAKLKMTSASSSMDLFRRKYLKEDVIKEQFITKDWEINDFIFKGYYGGRTEAFKRGLIQDAYYYDINSLYPSVMRNAYPLPQSVKQVKQPNESMVHRYMGVTQCSVRCPKDMKHPILPVKSKKLLFPIGEFSGTWNNVELSYALQNGYELLSIDRMIIYQESHFPFKEYVEDLYLKRQQYKDVGSAHEQVVKLMMNSLYGKFAQRKMEDYKVFSTENIPEEFYLKAVGNPIWDCEVIDDKTVFKKEKMSQGVFIFPIYSSYTTSYARILMHKYITQGDAIYTDTDSIITFHQIPESHLLGEMKLEGEIREGVIVKPKFYMLDNKPKIKGLNKADHKDFDKLMHNGTVEKMRFSSIKESVRRRMQPNTTIIVPKRMSLEDDKRLWEQSFSHTELQHSTPQEICMLNGEYVLVQEIQENIIQL